MIISRPKKFIFVHVPKTAGTSIRRSLGKHTRTFNGRFVKNVLKPKDFLHYLQFPAHLRAHQIRQLVGRDFYDSAFTFAFVRNPWDREVSMYHYILQTDYHHLHPYVSKLPDFAAYVRWLQKEAPYNQWDFIADCRQGELLVDYVARFENIGEEFEKITQRIGIKSDLPKANTSKRAGDYRAYYDDETRDIVGRIFATDVEKFGYEF